MSTIETTSLAADICHEHERAQATFRTAVEHATRCGELLAEAKAQVPHGSWLPWLDAHFPAGRRTAQGYMRLAHRAEDAQALAHLGVEGALRELAAPVPRSLLDDLQAMLPDLAGSEWDAFKASIARFGVLVPVVQDENGRVLDGRQRVRAAVELGLDYRVDLVAGLSDDEKGALVFSLNSCLRPHFTDAEDQREWIAARLEPRA